MIFLNSPLLIILNVCKQSLFKKLKVYVYIQIIEILKPFIKLTNYEGRRWE